MWRRWMTAGSCLRGRRSRVSFRSCYGLALLRRDGLSDSCDFAELASPTVRMESQMDAELRFHLDAYVEDLVGSGVPRDRKSTRLNSSHVSISYAVFCLKKKTE